MNQIQKNKLKRYTLVAFIVTTLYYVIEYLFGTKNHFVDKFYLWSPDGNGVLFGSEFITLTFKVSNFWNIPLVTILVAYFLFKKYSSSTTDKKDIFFIWILLGSAYGVLLALSGFFGMIINIVIIGAMYGILSSSITLSEDKPAEVEIFYFKTEIKSYSTALIGTSVFYGMFYNLVFGIVIGAISLLIGFIVFSVSFNVFGCISGYVCMGASHSWNTSKKWLSGK